MLMVKMAGRLDMIFAFCNENMNKNYLNHFEIYDCVHQMGV